MQEAHLIVAIKAHAGTRVLLDFRQKLGERVEIECFQFVVPPIEFRLMRNAVPLQDWQAGNTEVYDLQHGPFIQCWGRHGQRFVNDLQHRNDVRTCGMLAKNLSIETTGLGFQISLLVWPRQSTFNSHPGMVESLEIVQGAMAP